MNEKTYFQPKPCIYPWTSWTFGHKIHKKLFINILTCPLILKKSVLAAK